MAFFSGRELIDLVIMTAAVGYIFLDIFKMPRHDTHYDPLQPDTGKWNDFLFACMVTAPAIILHEMSHKFVGLFYGLTATFHAAYTWLGLGIALKLLNTGVIFFVPGYVSLSPSGPLETAATAFAGPFLNLVLFLGATVILKSDIKLSHRWQIGLGLTKKINLFLFFLNMVPLGFFDGAKVLSGLLTYFGY